MNNRQTFITATLFAALAIGLGAFGAHALKDVLIPERLHTWETAVTYHMWHALGMMLLAIVSKIFEVDLKTPINLILSGIVIFSGSLYVLCLTDISWFGAITPVGGICFILGWLVVMVQIIKQKEVQ